MAFNPGESIVGYYLQKEMLDEAQQGLPWHNYFHRLPFPVYIGQFATPYPSTEFAAQVRENSLVVLDDDEDLFHHQINTIPNSLLDDVPVRTMDGPLSRIISRFSCLAPRQPCTASSRSRSRAGRETAVWL